MRYQLNHTPDIYPNKQHCKVALCFSKCGFLVTYLKFLNFTNRKAVKSSQFLVGGQLRQKTPKTHKNRYDSQIQWEIMEKLRCTATVSQLDSALNLGYAAIPKLSSLMQAQN